jgi:hypothetical protein
MGMAAILPGFVAFAIDRITPHEDTSANVGIGICQVALAKRQPELMRLLDEEFDHPLESWIVMHEDLRRVPRIRASFVHLVVKLTAYCAQN